MGIPLLAPGDYAFPDPARALSEYEGLVGVSRDLDAGRLLEAYRCTFRARWRKRCATEHIGLRQTAVLNALWRSVRKW